MLCTIEYRAVKIEISPYHTKRLTDRHEAGVGMVTQFTLLTVVTPKISKCKQSKNGGGRRF